MAKQKLDVQALVADLGGPTTLQGKLRRKGHDISVKAINMWVYRKRIPGDWLSVLITDMGVNIKKFPATADDLTFLD